MGVMDKTVTLDEIVKRRNISPSEIAYMGDDTNDLGIMERVGLSACPNDATKFAKDTADFIVKTNGGYGAIRDLCEIIIEAKSETSKKKKGKK